MGSDIFTRRAFTKVPGFPLGNIDVLPKTGISAEENTLNQGKGPRTASFIRFVRNRIMYSRCELDASGNIRFGLKRHRKHPSSLNRYILII